MKSSHRPKRKWMLITAAFALLAVSVVAWRLLSPETKWRALISTESCLGGGQDYIDGPGDGSCFTNKYWATYIGNRSDVKINFLVRKFDSKRITKVHNCNVGYATEGELAVYALQHITKKLWIDYNGTNASILSSIAEYKTALSEGTFVSAQSILWSILESEPQRQSLKDYFSGSQAEQVAAGNRP